MVHSECCLWFIWPGLPCCANEWITCCKLAKLDWNKIEHQNTLFQYFCHFYPISGIHRTLKKCHMYFSIKRSTWKHIIFTVSLRNNFMSLCITFMISIRVYNWHFGKALKISNFEAISYWRKLSRLHHSNLKGLYKKFNLLKLFQCYFYMHAL